MQIAFFTRTMDSIFAIHSIVTLHDVACHYTMQYAFTVHATMLFNSFIRHTGYIQAHYYTTMQLFSTSA